MIKDKQALKAKLDAIPAAPGIYKMLDSKGTIIYIGKSKCLQKRVKSYFVASPKWEKVKKMVPFIREIEYVVTDTHLEAMLLECRLIKEIQPYFNVQMKNDSRYVYVKIASDDISVVHEKEKNCYGPFRSKHALQKRLDDLKNIYPIEKNKHSYQFEYHVFPLSLTRKENEENYKVIKEMFENTQKMECLAKQLELKMNEESANFRFESATKYRDLAQTIRYLKDGINRYKEINEKNILLKFEICNGYKLIFVSKGQVICKQRYTDISEQDQNLFIEKALKKSNDVYIDLNDKSYIDYRDVLYSEILSLPEECVLVFDT